MIQVLEFHANSLNKSIRAYLSNCFNALTCTLSVSEANGYSGVEKEEKLRREIFSICLLLSRTHSAVMPKWSKPISCSISFKNWSFFDKIERLFTL